MWRACQNILPTKDNLVKRKIIQDPLCPICGLEPETSFIFCGIVLLQEMFGESTYRSFKKGFHIGLNLSK
jgi:hypothetical protein